MVVGGVIPLQSQKVELFLVLFVTKDPGSITVKLMFVFRELKLREFYRVMESSLALKCLCNWISNHLSLT